MPTVPSKAIRLDDAGAARAKVAAQGVRHAKTVVPSNGEQVELSAGLSNRRKLYIKPIRVGVTNRRRSIVIGPSGFDPVKGTRVWEEFELVLDVDANVRVFAKIDVIGEMWIDVRLLEIGED